jgi:hypothetical protein
MILKRNVIKQNRSNAASRLLLVPTQPRWLHVAKKLQTAKLLHVARKRLTVKPLPAVEKHARTRLHVHIRGRSVMLPALIIQRTLIRHNRAVLLIVQRVSDSIPFSHGVFCHDEESLPG